MGRSFLDTARLADRFLGSQRYFLLLMNVSLEARSRFLQRTYSRSDSSFRLPHRTLQNQLIRGVAEMIDTCDARS